MIGWASHDSEQWGILQRSFKLQCDVDTLKKILEMSSFPLNIISFQMCALNSAVFFYYLVFLVQATDISAAIEQDFILMCLLNSMLYNFVFFHYYGSAFLMFSSLSPCPRLVTHQLDNPNWDKMADTYTPHTGSVRGCDGSVLSFLLSALSGDTMTTAWAALI